VRVVYHRCLAWRDLHSRRGAAEIQRGPEGRRRLKGVEQRPSTRGNVVFISVVTEAFLRAWSSRPSGWFTSLDSRSKQPVAATNAFGKPRDRRAQDR
jgi:hypothetical protein